jgi:predicted RND superfamily exporter protein
MSYLALVIAAVGGCLFGMRAHMLYLTSAPQARSRAIRNTLISTAVVGYIAGVIHIREFATSLSQESLVQVLFVYVQYMAIALYYWLVAYYRRMLPFRIGK